MEYNSFFDINVSRYLLLKTDPDLTGFVLDFSSFYNVNSDAYLFYQIRIKYNTCIID